MNRIPDNPPVVAKHVGDFLIKQGRPSMGEISYVNAHGEAVKNYTCAYVGDDNTRCAAGCLVPNTRLRLLQEGKSAEGNAYFRQNFRESLELISELQRVHDEAGRHFENVRLSGHKPDWQHLLCDAAYSRYQDVLEIYSDDFVESFVVFMNAIGIDENGDLI